MSGWVDKDKLEKIIFNLLSNAFKHSGKNEKVIFAANENKAAKKLEILVTNSGSQLPKGKLDKIFDKFYTAKDDISGSKNLERALASHLPGNW